jgi:iron complex outermembrane recepter protein
MNCTSAIAVMACEEWGAPSLSGRTGKSGLLRWSTAIAAVLIINAASTVAIAQESGSPQESNGQAAATDGSSFRDEIVVTGTLVRGIVPAGANVVSVNEQVVEASGATTVTELLADVPQFGSFNSVQTLTAGGNFVTTNRPNLRNLPGFTTTGTSATLLLIDGYRVVGMGIQSTTPDADFVPPGILERVEIVPDGGSALYGSDAVAGVVNFITRKRFDGIELDARYGFGEDYHTFDANATVGKEWGDGSIFVSYNYTENGAIHGRDRDFNFTPFAVVSGVTIRSLQCPMPNIQVQNGAASTLFSKLDPAAANSGNICDLTDGSAFEPNQERHSVYAGLNQQLNDWLEVDLRGFYCRKKTDLPTGFISGTVSLSGAPRPGFQTSPFDRNLTGDPAEIKTVNFAVGPEDAGFQKNVTIDAWGFTSNMAADLSESWQARLHGAYSESTTIQRSTRLNTPNLNAAVRSGAFNPFGPGTITAAAFASITDFENFGRADQTQVDIRLIADGDLFALPGGMAKLAIGAEYIHETYDSRKGDTIPANENLLPKINQSRNVKSVFGEIVAPILGADGAPSLTVSASGRYDDYSDFGDGVDGALLRF